MGFLTNKHTILVRLRLHLEGAFFVEREGSHLGCVEALTTHQGVRVPMRFPLGGGRVFLQGTGCYGFTGKPTGRPKSFWGESNLETETPRWLNQNPTELSSILCQRYQLLPLQGGGLSRLEHVAKGPKLGVSPHMPGPKIPVRPSSRGTPRATRRSEVSLSEGHQRLLCGFGDRCAEPRRLLPGSPP